MIVIQDGYEDMLEPQKVQLNIWFWIAQEFKPVLPVNVYPKPTPEGHKLAVLKSARIQSLIKEISQSKGVKEDDVERSIKQILDEVGYKKSIKIIKFLGLLLSKICLKVCSGIYINYADVEKLKNQMGNCPVVFVPTHRSYADFILFSFVCFYYNIQIPAIAAAMDFHGMMGMGEMLRNTGAFYIKRASNDDPIYWPTFREYIYQLIAHGDEPMEFFIEGTRSRTNKSLAPKYGLMMMILKALFLAQVPDILFVPVSINYDRVLEESLFSFELLGIPKPKESTSRFFKSLKIIKERFGKIYIHFDEPISARTFFGADMDRAEHSLGPIHIHDLSDKERDLIPPLAYEIVRRQQASTVLSYFNLIALVLNNSLTRGQQFVPRSEMKEEVDLLRNVLLSWGGKLFTVDTVTSINESLEVHSNLIYEHNGNIGLVANKIETGPINPEKLKAHEFSGDTINYSVPFVMLQVYVNPVLHYLVDAALIVVILRSPGKLAKDELFKHFRTLRSILSLEFVLLDSWYNTHFEQALTRLFDQRIIKIENGQYDVLENNYLEEVLISSIQPFILTYFVVAEVLQKITDVISEKALLTSIQKLFEDAIKEKKIFIHPYCMSLDILSNSLTCYANKSLLRKIRKDNQNFYQVNHERLIQLKEELEVYLPSFHIIKSFEIFLHIRSKI